MPCHEVRTVSVEFKIGNIELLKKALNSLNYTIKAENNNIILLINNEKLGFNINFKTSSLESTYYTPKELTNFSNQLKQAYSKVVIDEIAKKQKWILKKQTDRKFQLQKF